MLNTAFIRYSQEERCHINVISSNGTSRDIKNVANKMHKFNNFQTFSAV
jgi:hypothetical protein